MGRDPGDGARYLRMRFASRKECTRAALERNLKFFEAGEIAQFKCVELERPTLFDSGPESCLRATRNPGDSYSDVIIRVARADKKISGLGNDL